jgi:hypothetical protein
MERLAISCSVLQLFNERNARQHTLLVMLDHGCKFSELLQNIRIRQRRLVTVCSSKVLLFGSLVIRVIFGIIVRVLVVVTGGTKAQNC